MPSRPRSTVTAATVLAVAAVTAVWASVSLASQDSPAERVIEFSSAQEEGLAEVRPGGTTAGQARDRDRRTTRPAPLPREVAVPSIGAAARVVPTGVTARGDAEIPRDGDDVGWYRYGARPGDQTGSAVLIGHRDTVAEGPGELFDLDDVRPGALVTVGAGQTTLRYEVVSLRSIVKAALPESLFRRDGAHRLVLITCGGAYLPDAGGYQENLVAVARPVDSASGSRR